MCNCDDFLGQGFRHQGIYSILKSGAPLILVECRTDIRGTDSIQRVAGGIIESKARVSNRTGRVVRKISG